MSHGLQWGRGCEPADINAVFGFPAVLFGFNGAAGVNPRISPGWRHRRGCPCCFNGAAGVNPRICLQINVGHRNATGFNGAAGVNPRIYERHTQTEKTQMSFNGAAGVNPRISLTPSLITFGRNSLQWGRGCEPADIGFSTHNGESVSSSFNGAAGVNPRIYANCNGRCVFVLASMGPRV